MYGLSVGRRKIALDDVGATKPTISLLVFAEQPKSFQGFPAVGTLKPIETHTPRPDELHFNVRIDDVRSEHLARATIEVVPGPIALQWRGGLLRLHGKELK